MTRATAIRLLSAAVLAASALLSSAWAGERAPILAGAWYPGGRAELAAWVEQALDKAGEASAPGRLVALAAPHAGYMYSGPTAARAYKRAKGGAHETVVVMAPSHRAAFPGVSVYDQGPYRTPLGSVDLDAEFIKALKAADPDVRYVPQAHAMEHAVEIQLPLIQSVLPGARLVPIVMGQQDPDTCRRLASALAQAAKGRNVLLVASTDLSHFHTGSQAEEMDGVLARAVADFDVDSLFDCLGLGVCEACGGGVLATVMLAAREMGADRAEVVEYTHSGRVTGDDSRVVGYMAAAFYQGGGKGGQGPALDQTPAEFGPAERETLHAIARESIATGLKGEEFVPPKDLTPLLKEERGAFVTLKRHGELRGCIGNVIGRMPLHETVAAMARAAAFQDPRFPPLDEDEFQDLEIEISVLSVPRVVEDPEAVVVGRDGLIMERGWRSGLLLPQVPVEWGWNREEFLDYTCRKAGMGQGCWKDPATRIFSFTAEVF